MINNLTNSKDEEVLYEGKFLRYVCGKSVQDIVEIEP